MLRFQFYEFHNCLHSSSVIHSRRRMFFNILKLSLYHFPISPFPSQVTTFFFKKKKTISITYFVSSWAFVFSFLCLVYYVWGYTHVLGSINSVSSFTAN